MILSRRAALAAALTTAFAAATPALAARRLFGPAGRPVGINLYMVAASYRADPEGTLEALAKIGFREFETDLSGPAPERVRAARERAGLACASVSVLPTPLRGGPSLATDPGELAKAVHTIGADYLVCTLFPLPPGVEMRPQPGESVEQMLARVSRGLSADHFKRTAEMLDAKGEALRREGVKLAYHNHNPELAPLGETNGLAILLEHTDPKRVAFEMDAGWVVAAGHDPVELLRAYPQRFKLMHVKDIAPAHKTNTALKADTMEVGSGVVNWPRVLRAAVDSGVRHFSVEQEPPYSRMPPLEAARTAYAYLSKLEI
ncbi:sugar phosphate isomerase/epimerase [Phenylobacterium sp. LjRoot219]|uniref:sugar phosphate isomerase/epimerase family protein n=1 Tax=Phenylobacterium sp. LjRoot219 TaxID=3342283 RepID=UPI003ECF37BB